MWSVHTVRHSTTPVPLSFKEVWPKHLRVFVMTYGLRKAPCRSLSRVRVPNAAPARRIPLTWTTYLFHLASRVSLFSLHTSATLFLSQHVTQRTLTAITNDSAVDPAAILASALERITIGDRAQIRTILSLDAV